MISEELLNQIKLKYPEGTEVLSLFAAHHIGEIVHIFVDGRLSVNEVWMREKTGKYNFLIYSKGKWAKILKLPYINYEIY